jgi:hypothetical protein
MPAEDKTAAPHGWRWSGKEWVPKRPAGRPRSAAPRVQSTSDARSDVRKSDPGKPADAAKTGAAYRTTISETLQSVWLLMAVAPLPDTAFGYDLRVTRVRARAQANILSLNLAQLSAGLATLAQHNDWTRRRVEALAKGKGGVWVLPVMMTLLPFAVQSMAVWSNMGRQELLAQAASAEQQAQEFIQAVLIEARAEADAMVKPPVDGEVVEVTVAAEGF